jgi:regulator of protease activity HflC (stomatin/prohibitin superfamily)
LAFLSIWNGWLSFELSLEFDRLKLFVNFSIMLETFSFPVIVIIAFLLLTSVRQVNQYERGIKFMFGKYRVTKDPGWRIVLPVIQSMTKVDIRTKTVDVPEQEAITKDNIPVGINAVIYYKVTHAEKAVLEVENFYYAIMQLAQVTMRNMVGQYTLDEILKNREEVSTKIQEQVDVATEPWGIQVVNLDLKDIVIPADLKRTIAKAAEAERERRAVIIQAEGEVMAAENVSKAARMLSESPGALHLRTLQSINDLSSDQSNTTVWMVPVEVLRALEGINQLLQKKGAEK